MFYEFVPMMCFPQSGLVLNCFQSRVISHAMKFPMTIWNVGGFRGKTICVTLLTVLLLTERKQTVYIVNSDKRKSNQLFLKVTSNLSRSNIKGGANSELVELNNGSSCRFIPLTWRCKIEKSIDVLILFVRNDENIDNLKLFVTILKYKYLLVVGDATKSEWLKILCKENWLDVIQ